jgi:hypothetical protein
MEAMRDVLRGTLGRSLRGIGEEDRLAAAWTVACGCAMADHGRVIGYQAGVVSIEVSDPVWLRQMLSLRPVLQLEVARIAGLPVTAIEFMLAKKPNTDQHRGHRSVRREKA